MHKQRRGGFSDYAIRLREKQKLKRYYGILEAQFRRCFKRAKQQKGITGLNLLRILETRLDNVVYHAGFALSRNQSRQVTRHGHILVNGRKVNIPSFSVKPGDVVEVAQKSKEKDAFKTSLEITKERVTPGWLECDRNNMKAKILRLPLREDITVPVEENMVVELYSR
jgi:small subunit ribosomal protein S4